VNNKNKFEWFTGWGYFPHHNNGVYEKFSYNGTRQMIVQQKQIPRRPISHGIIIDFNY
jgi:hypothetical protein